MGTKPANPPWLCSLLAAMAQWNAPGVGPKSWATFPRLACQTPYLPAKACNEDHKKPGIEVLAMMQRLHCASWLGVSVRLKPSSMRNILRAQIGNACRLWRPQDLLGKVLGVKVLGVKGRGEGHSLPMDLGIFWGWIRECLFTLDKSLEQGFVEGFD